MKRFIQLSIIVAIAGIHSALLANPPVIADQKIGIVDLQKVFASYYKTERSNKAIEEEVADLRKQSADLVTAEKKREDEWQKLMDKSDDQAISADERAKAKKEAGDKYQEVKAAQEEVQRFDQISATRMNEKRRQRHDDIVKEIRGVLNAQAKAAGFTLVLDVSGESANTVPVVIYSAGVNDLTTNLIKELNAGAPQ